MLLPLILNTDIMIILLWTSNNFETDHFQFQLPPDSVGSNQPCLNLTSTPHNKVKNSGTYYILLWFSSFIKPAHNILRKRHWICMKILVSIRIKGNIRSNFGFTSGHFAHKKSYWLATRITQQHKLFSKANLQESHHFVLLKKYNSKWFNFPCLLKSVCFRRSVLFAVCISSNWNYSHLVTWAMHNHSSIGNGQILGIQSPALLTNPYCKRYINSNQ